MKMCKLLRTLNIIVFLILISGCILPPNLFKAEEDIEELSIDIGEVKTLTINWRNGTIGVNSDPTSSEITITGKKYTWANTAERAEAALDDITVSLDPDDTSPTVAVLKFEAPKDSSGVTYGSDVEIVVPTNVMIDINSVNGDIMVEQIEGDTNIVLVNGTITIDSSDGNIDINSVNSEITIDSSDGNIDINNVNGDIMVEQIEGDTNIILENGAISIDSTGGNVEAINTNGTVTIKARPNVNGIIRGETVNGSVFIQVPPDFGATVDLRVVIGAVVAAFDEFDSVDIQEEESLIKITGVLNGGGGEIIGGTTTGNVTLNALE